MVIYSYTLPAILALTTKVAILCFFLRSLNQGLKTRLFLWTVVFSIVLSVTEILILQKIFPYNIFHIGVVWYIASIPMLALLSHMAILISMHKRSPISLVVLITTYTYAALLIGLLLFTRLIVIGAEDLNGYTATRIPGPLYWLYEIFVISILLTIIALPFFGLQNDRPAVLRNQCKLWLVTAIPLSIVIITVVISLHLGYRWFNATVISPLLLTLLLMAIGYSIHSRRVIDLSFFVPWSKARKSKNEFYSKLASLVSDVPRFTSVQSLLSHLADILKCPVILVGADTWTNINNDLQDKVSNFPRNALVEIKRLTVANEIRESAPVMHRLMLEHKIAAVVPFFSSSNSASCWLFFGENFDRQVNTPQDFVAIENLLKNMAGLFLDKMFEMNELLKQSQRRINALEVKKHESIQKEPINNNNEPLAIESLQKAVSEFEARIIKETLDKCGGNQAKAARLLGLKANTLYYKIERYDIKADQE